MKWFITGLLAVCFISTGFSQTIESDFSLQLKKIILSSASNFSSLRTGKAIQTHSGVQYQSKVAIEGADSSIIQLSTNNFENDSYIITIKTSVSKAESMRLNTFWDNQISGALGNSANKECHVVDIDEISGSDQCDYKIIRKDYTTVVALRQITLNEIDSYTVDIRITKIITN